MRHYLLSLVLASAVLTGCGEDDETESDPEEEGILANYPPLDLTPGNVAAFATASAPNMFMIGIVLVAVPSLEMDPACPKVTETATQTTYEGGCTTMEGNNVVGKAVITENADGNATIQYLGWGMGESAECQGVPVSTLLTYTGVMNYSRTGVGAASFDLALELEAEAPHPESCATITSTAAYDYAGNFVGSEGAEGMIDLEQASTWNGSGEIGVQTLGKVGARTENEVVDGSVCESEAASGTTTLSSGPNTAVITYDGLIDCEMESTVTWSYNGQDQGEMSGVRCSSTGRRAIGHGYLFALGLGLVALMRRRR